MPYITPAPDELSKPFWDAVQERRLIVQQCSKCNELQYPPRPRCQDCGSEELGWKETSGKGRILTFGILEDSHLPVRAADHPALSRRELAALARRDAAAIAAQ